LREQVQSLPIADEVTPDLAPYLSVEQLSTSLEGLRRPSEHTPHRTLERLIKVAPHMPVTLLGEGVDLAGALEEKQEDLKARVFMILGPFLPREVAARLQAARKIQSPGGGRVLGTIFLICPPRSRGMPPHRRSGGFPEDVRPSGPAAE
jgi:hypothetical protein